MTENALRQSTVAEAAKSTAVKPKVGLAEGIASPKPKAASKSKSNVAAAAPATATQETRKAK